MAKKILIIDDSRTMRDMLRMTLEEAGYEVVAAEDGKRGLALLERERPELVVTDINMPVLDGFGFIEEARRNPAGRALPILVLTTESSPEKKQRARAAGATGWIVKPFDPAVLIKTIARVSPRRSESRLP